MPDGIVQEFLIFFLKIFFYYQTLLGKYNEQEGHHGP